MDSSETCLPPNPFSWDWEMAPYISGWTRSFPKPHLVNCRGDIVRHGDQDGLVRDVSSPQPLREMAPCISGWTRSFPKPHLVNCRGDIMHHVDQDGLVQDASSPPTPSHGIGRWPRVSRDGPAPSPNIVPRTVGVTSCVTGIRMDSSETRLPPNLLWD
jgi:hypothetical protein